MNTTAPNQTYPSSPSVANLLNYRGPPPEQTAYPAHLFTCSTFHFDLSTLPMRTQPQNLSREMMLRAYKALILLAYKAALQMSRILYKCRESSTLVEKTLQITPFYAKQTQFSQRPNQSNPLWHKGLRK